MGFRWAILALIFTALFSQLTSAQPGKMRLVFRKIDGQTYYEILGVSDTSAAKEIIQAKAWALLKSLHPDSGSGDHDRVVIINEAYDVLKDPEKRALYDQWLGLSSSPSAETEEQQRAHVLEIIIREINKAVLKEVGRSFSPDIVQLADLAHLLFLYNVRFMPTASFEVSEIGNLLFETALSPQNPYTIILNSRIALAGGAIRWLQEQAPWYSQETGQRNPQWWLDRLKQELQKRLQDGDRDGRLDMHRYMWWYLTGQDLRPQPDSNSNCQQMLYATVTDSEGRTYRVPIRVEIEIGF